MQTYTDSVIATVEIYLRDHLFLLVIASSFRITCLTFDLFLDSRVKIDGIILAAHLRITSEVLFGDNVFSLARPLATVHGLELASRARLEHVVKILTCPLTLHRHSILEGEVFSAHIVRKALLQVAPLDIFDIPKQGKVQGTRGKLVRVKSAQ